MKTRKLPGKTSATTPSSIATAGARRLTNLKSLGTVAAPHHESIAHESQSAPEETVQAQDLTGRFARQESLRNAMVRGDADAPITLANMYLDGKEVPRNCDQALRLLESAADKGSVRARSRLAALYAIGTCVRRDRLQAYRWLTMALAVDPKNSWAQQNRDLTWGQMTAEERIIAGANR